MPEVHITPGRSGYGVVVHPFSPQKRAVHHVSDLFDLHRLLDRLFPPQKPETLADTGPGMVGEAAGK